MRDYDYSRACGKTMNNILKTACKSCASLSTTSRISAYLPTLACDKLVVIQKQVTFYALDYTHEKSALSSLFEHYFYPVSTAPITINPHGIKN